MHIRSIEPQDRHAWRRLFLAYGEFYETAFDDDVLEGVWSWLLDPDHPVMGVVAVEGEEVVGFAHVRRVPDTFTASDSWFLDDLYVDPDRRGEGTATALLDAVADRCSDAGGGTLRWITAADNTTAQRVYDRLATRTTWVTYERET